MTVGRLIDQLRECVSLWPEMSELPVTFEGRVFDLVIPCTPSGQGPVTDPKDRVGGVDLSDSGLTSEDFDRHL